MQLIHDQIPSKQTFSSPSAVLAGLEGKSANFGDQTSKEMTRQTHDGVFKMVAIDAAETET